MNDRLNRRQFVKTALAGTASATLASKLTFASEKQPFDPKGLPTRKFGKLGIRVPLLGHGLGGRWLSNKDDDEALADLEHALDNGVFYWDTAAIYENERISSEQRLGRLLPSRRKEVFLVSKVRERSADKARASIERSLRRLRTDYIDLMHVHSIQSVRDAELLGEPGKVLRVLEEYKSQGIIRHIGFTGHTSAEGMKRAAELYDFEVMMIALNHVRELGWVRIGHEPFEQQAMPYAAQKGIAVVAMKVIAPRRSVQGLSVEDLVRYALTDRRFSLAVISMNSRAQLEDNLRIIRDFKPLDPGKMKRMRVALEPFYRGDNVAWMQPDYLDGFS